MAIPDRIWIVILETEKWTTENGTWFEDLGDALEYIDQMVCLDDLLCMVSSHLDKKTGLRTHSTINPLDVEEWVKEHVREREEEARHRAADLNSRP